MKPYIFFLILFTVVLLILLIHLLIQAFVLDGVVKGRTAIVYTTYNDLEQA